jgi:hypothetical protein
MQEARFAFILSEIYPKYVIKVHKYLGFQNSQLGI